LHAIPLGRWRDLNRPERRRLATDLRRVEAEVGEAHGADLLVLGRHDPLQAGVARLVDAGLHRDDGRQLQVDDLQLVVPELPLDPHLRAVLQGHPHDGGRTWPSHAPGHEPTHLGVVVVVRLQAGEDEGEPLFLHRRGDHAGQGERVASFEGCVLDVNGSIGAGREAGPQDGRGAIRPHRQRHHFGRHTGILELQHLLQGIAIVVVEAECQIALVNPGGRAVDPEG
jgi:hypothetical protein